MEITIDSVGRIVVPKPFRDGLGLRGGEILDMELRDGRLEIEIPPTPMRLEKRGAGPVAVADREMPTLTVEQVRETLEQVRR